MLSIYKLYLYLTDALAVREGRHYAAEVVVEKGWNAEWRMENGSRHKLVYKKHPPGQMIDCSSFFILNEKTHLATS